MCSTKMEALGAQLDALAAEAVTGLSITEMQQRVAALSTVANRVAGLLSRTVGELADRSGGTVPAGADGQVAPLTAWLRDATHASGSQTGRQVNVATRLRELPAVGDAMVDGTLSAEHGRALARLVGRLDAGTLTAIEDQLIHVASIVDPHDLGQYVSHLIATWCEPALIEDERAAQLRRYLQVRNNRDGSWSGRFSLPDAGMETLLSALEPLARKAGDDDERSVGQRRADALVDLAEQVLRHGDLPDAGGDRPHLTVVLPAGWACGHTTPMTTDLDLVGSGGACATGSYTGPVTRAHAETLGCDGVWHRLVLDHTGQAARLESIGERISAAQRRAVAARDRACVARGCTRPPALCDLHHLHARQDGGATTIENMVTLCRRHHLAWHRGDLTLERLRVPWLEDRPPPEC